MRFLTTVLFFMIFSTVSQANSDSGSASLSCSGNISLCEGCQSQYYYIYAYQYAYINNGKVQNENHNFNMNGFLGSAQDYRIMRPTSRHILYSNGLQILAIPFKDSQDGIWIMGDGMTGPGEPPRTWIQLCPN